jgi:hypothetical protein
MSHEAHFKQMLYGAAAIFGVLLVVGVPVGTALYYGLLLACPLMMVWMLITMNIHGHGGASSHESTRHGASQPVAERPDGTRLGAAEPR